MFKKEDLKTGDYLVNREMLVYQAFPELGVMMDKSGGWLLIESFNDNFKLINKDIVDSNTIDESMCDIMKVYRPVDTCSLGFRNFDKGELMFINEDNYDTYEVIIDASRFNDPVESRLELISKELIRLMVHNYSDISKDRLRYCKIEVKIPKNN